MTAALLFAATFAAVITLGLQQINVERRHVLAAVLTSPFIGLSHLVLFKLLPGPTDALEIAAYLAGGSAGIAAAIWAHPRIVGLLARRRAAGTQAAQASAAALQAAADRLGETLRLATAIADDAARADIECWCTYQRMGLHTWYDSTSVCPDHAKEYREGIDTAVRYLRLRGRLVEHPMQPHLVRFAADAVAQQQQVAAS